MTVNLINVRAHRLHALIHQLQRHKRRRKILRRFVVDGIVRECLRGERVDDRNQLRQRQRNVVDVHVRVVVEEKILAGRFGRGWQRLGGAVEFVLSILRLDVKVGDLIGDDSEAVVEARIAEFEEVAALEHVKRVA